MSHKARQVCTVVNIDFLPKDRVKDCPTARYVGAGDYVCECKHSCPAKQQKATKR